MYGHQLLTSYNNTGGAESMPAGRPKGSLAKINVEAKEYVMEAFHALGGTQGLVAWALLHPTEFYLGMFRQLIPKQVQANVNSVSSNINLNAVEVKDSAQALNVLERLLDARDALSGSGGGDIGRTLDGPLPAHQICVQPVDEGGAGAEPAYGPPDAPETREDEHSGGGVALPLPQSLPPT
jgi:hypothetical protein